MNRDGLDATGFGSRKRETRARMHAHQGKGPQLVWEGIGTSSSFQPIAEFWVKHFVRVYS